MFEFIKMFIAVFLMFLPMVIAFAPELIDIMADEWRVASIRKIKNPVKAPLVLIVNN